MRGFVVQIRRAKNEDLVVTLLTPRKLGSWYRFYGARHSILQLGYLIDFESDEGDGRFLPRLRGVSHLGFPWLKSRNRLMHWQRFIALFEPHLRDTELLDSFYFDLLLEAAGRWSRQNPKRVVCETHHRLLSHEGRLHPPRICHICERPLQEEVAVMSALQPAHPGCIYAPSLPLERYARFIESGRCTWLDDDEVSLLYDASMKGL